MAKEGFKKFQAQTSEKKIDEIQNMMEQLAIKVTTLESDISKYETLFGSVEDIDAFIDKHLEKKISKDMLIDLKHSTKLSLEKYVDQRFDDFRKLAADIKKDREMALSIIEMRKKSTTGYEAFQNLFLNYGVILNGSLTNIKQLMDDIEAVYGLKVIYYKTVPQNCKLKLLVENYTTEDTSEERS